MSYGRPPPKLDGMVSLKVSNLTYRTTSDDLRCIFSKYGSIGDVYIPKDRFSRQSRGFAFVRYEMSYGRPPPRIEGMVSLKVDNLTYRTTPEDLRRVFERCGEVGDIYIPRDRFSRESRGFAFVRFYDKRDAEDALDAMDGRLLDGRELRVQMARYGRPSSPYRRGRRRRSGFYPNAYNNKSRSRSRRRSRSRSRSRSRRRSYSRSRSRSHSRSRSDSKSSRGRSHSRSRSGSKSRSRSK